MPRNYALCLASVIASGTSSSSGISVSNYAGSSIATDVVDNVVTGYSNDINLVSGSTGAYVFGNHLTVAQADGILVQSGVSGAVLWHNSIVGAAAFGCEDDTTGSGTAGTANTWTQNTSTVASSPATICKLISS